VSAVTGFALKSCHLFGTVHKAIVWSRFILGCDKVRSNFLLIEREHLSVATTETATDARQNLHIAELHDLYFSHNIATVIK
jgi:hypothetical protein